jgi:hypothetical protein
MLQDPFDEEKNAKDQNDREQSRKQTDESHACGAFSIEDPDQYDSHNEQQEERANAQAYICLSCVLT